MERPDGCSLEIYDIMKDCWQEDPDLRPPFDDLSHTIQQLMNLDTAVRFVRVFVSSSVNLILRIFLCGCEFENFDTVGTGDRFFNYSFF